MYEFAPVYDVDLKKVKLEKGDMLLHNNGTDHFAYLEEFLASKLQKHQIHGVKFLYNSIS